MRPAIQPADWLLTDPTIQRWPRRGAVVVIREPESDVLALKRVAARPGEVVRDIPVTDPETGQDVDVTIRLGPDEAWLVGDDPTVVSIDSRRYGPVGLDRLVARAWFRYWPLRRIGRLRQR
jgi:hypothetical protein